MKLAASVLLVSYKLSEQLLTTQKGENKKFISLLKMWEQTLGLLNRKTHTDREAVNVKKIDKLVNSLWSDRFFEAFLNTIEAVSALQANHQLQNQTKCFERIVFVNNHAI